VGDVDGVKRLELVEAGKRALVVSPGKLGFQIKLHLSRRVILQGVGRALSERNLSTGPEGVTVEELLELVDGSELRARGKDGERLLEKEAREAAPLFPKQPPVLEGGWHRGHENKGGLIDPTGLKTNESRDDGDKQRGLSTERIPRWVFESEDSGYGPQAWRGNRAALG
jgi:hypothetical protein